MTTLPTIPEISITLAGETSSNTLLTPPLTPVFPETLTFSETRFVTTLRGRLVVPPRPSDGPSRRTLVQRGLRLGSFRLNCTESLGVGARTLSTTPSADIASTRRAFNWSRIQSPLQGGVGMGGNGNNSGITRAQSHRGHSRARSLNSLADLNETFKMNVVQPNNNNSAGSYIPKHQHGPRTPSIDLSILNFNSNSSNPSHHFASAL